VIHEPRTGGRLRFDDLQSIADAAAAGRCTRPARGSSTRILKLSEASHEMSEKRYWFPAKRYGWGWGPPTMWQGWVVLIVLLLAIAAAALLFMPKHLVAFLGFNLVMIVLLLLICYAKGEPPAWRWGDR
jgi:hypothetical protein